MRGWFHGRALGAVALCLILASTIFLTGCGHGGSIVPGVRWERSGSRATEQDLALYSQAVEALKAGKYEQAERLFNDVFVASTDVDLAGRARYGQAVAKLGAAGDRQGRQQGLAMWDGWSKGWPTPETCPDPRFFEPLLPRLAPDRSKSASLKGQAPDALGSQNVQTEDLARQLDEALRENADMRDKIRALEELHQEMQIRQKKLISP